MLSHLLSDVLPSGLVTGDLKVHRNDTLVWWCWSSSLMSLIDYYHIALEVSMMIFNGE